MKSGKISSFDRAYLKKELEPLYLNLIRQCGEAGISIRKSIAPEDKSAYTCVPMFVGSDYTIGGDDSVMVVGRAVNGWDIEWPEDPKEKVKQLLDLPFDLASINDLPEQNGYFFSRSRFFLVIRELMQRLCADCDNWSSRFAWSNLYKVAPAIAGNPSGKVQHIQRESAIEILKKEIDLLKPRYILFVTGYDFTTWSWHNSTTERTFQKAFDIQPTNALGAHVEGYAFYNGSKIVVACRPETRSVADWVACVTHAFQNS